jgi:hypothetical protein
MGLPRGLSGEFMSERKANVALVRPYFATIEHGVEAEVELSGDATVGDA